MGVRAVPKGPTLARRVGPEGWGPRYSRAEWDEAQAVQGCVLARLTARACRLSRRGLRLCWACFSVGTDVENCSGQAGGTHEVWRCEVEVARVCHRHARRACFTITVFSPVRLECSLVLLVLLWTPCIGGGREKAV